MRAKKYDEAKDRWQARVNKDWWFYFKIEGDTYFIVDLIPLRQEPGLSLSDCLAVSYFYLARLGLFIAPRFFISVLRWATISSTVLKGP